MLDANDSFVSTVTLAGGALGTVHATRWATGHMNSLRVRVYGDEGAVEVDLDRSYDQYRISTGKQGIRKAQWKDVTCRKTPTQYARFIAAIKAARSDVSDFANGARVQAYLASSFQSDATGRPVKVKL